MDYIYITNDNNEKIQMEVVSIFEIKNKEFKYIIYRELDASHYYLAKFKDNVEELNTDFTDEEYKLCNDIFLEVVNK